MNKFYKIQGATNILFENKAELLPSVTELFEYELAYLEYKTLPENEYLQRTAYAKSYKGKETLHFLRYNEIPDKVSKNRTSAANAYFKNGLFSTGYATHSLFPYRGKFHPQLIKALLNILGIKKGDYVLDPMSGSGTTNIEAALLGINSCAIDISPFCQMMTKTKYDALKMNKSIFDEIDNEPDKLFEFFSSENVLEKIKSINKDKKEVYELSL